MVSCTVIPCSSEAAERFGRTYRFHVHCRIISETKDQENQAESRIQFLLASYFYYSSTLEIEAIYSSEMSDSVRTTRLYNPEDHNIQ